MNLSQYLMPILLKPKEPTFLFISQALNHTLSITNTIINPNTNPNSSPSPPLMDCSPTIMATQLSNCTNLSQLNQVYARILRTQMLKSFPGTFNWNNIIKSYIRLESYFNALFVFVDMLRACTLPDTYTLPFVVKAICQVFDKRLGEQVHSVALKVGLERNEYCESGFINFYCKGGEFENARRVFDENPNRKLGSWNAIIGGLSQGGRSRKAIAMFLEMMRNGFSPDDVTMVSVISACGSIGDLYLGFQLHKYVFQVKNSEKSDILMLNSVIDMYGKCGRMDLAYRVFSEMEIQNVSSWTSMIVGYAMHGYVNEALDCFRYMREAGVRPNHVTFVGVLSACVHGGKVQEGKYYFKMMKGYKISPRLQHYGCMVDLLGRAGLFAEARVMIEDMPMKANVVIWGCLMGACEKYENVEMGEWVAKHLQELEPWNDGVYVVLSNIYASNCLWEEVERVRKIMKGRRLSKVPAFSIATDQS